MSSKLEYKDFYRRNLPHYQPTEAVLFITYRLAFSLPKIILQQLQQKMEEYQMRSAQLPEQQRPQLSMQYHKILFAMEDEFLDKYTQSPQWLSHDVIAQVVIENLVFYHMIRYELICVLIMSNHVHLVLKPLLQRENTPYSLAKIMKDHKSYVAHEANKILQRTGRFWHHENYDHWIRDEDELKRILNYIMQNPVKAGLVANYQEWKHSWLNTAYL